jgi:hypothetical protein
MRSRSPPSAWLVASIKFVRACVIEVAYTYTVDDYVAFCCHYRKRTGGVRLGFWCMLLLVPMGCLYWFAFHRTSFPEHTLTAVVVSIVWVIVYPICHRTIGSESYRAVARTMETYGHLGRITLILAEETLTERTAAFDTVARWDKMFGIEEVGDVTYIYVTGFAAAIIPKHGFRRSDDYERVRDFAMGKLAQRKIG